MNPAFLPASHRYLLLLLALGAVALTAVVADNGFFWDGVLQASRYAQWYYDTGFRHLLVPESYDSGHPPLLGLLLAGAWKLFGRSLPVGHWLMLPALLGIIWQLYRLARRFLPPAWVLPGTVLLVAEPTLLGQSALVSADVLMVFCYLLAFNSQLSGRRGWLALSLLPLGLLSTRGTLLIVALFLTDAVVLQPWREGRRLSSWLRWGLPYVPATLLVCAWLAFHYQAYGWVIYHAGSAWAGNTQVVGWSVRLRNIGIIGWRLLDFGRVALGLAALVIGVQVLRRKLVFSRDAAVLLAALLAPVLVVSSSFVPYANPIGHRYFLPAYLLLALNVLYYLPRLRAGRWVYAALLLSLLSGHFWVYPETIAKGWDGTLAHLPYFGLRRQMLTYLNAHRIPLGQVGSEFPNAYPLCQADLAADCRRFAPKDLSRNPYLLQSNVMNGFSDQELETLRTRWVMVQEVRAGQMYFRLYRRPE
ncbi:hypothetical protein LJY25_13795 [Hymenobacter sp. BT175]|uniref:hypothetical protein n=1 Tax=Hymenobacter translucens TaxID=2886507 RepID=UPI001D0E788B|nr:hypothetical protein [Hymenobacter translucens]MCC2547524.1 hypothetical protein [Hymenobacter translucens]